MTTGLHPLGGFEAGMGVGLARSRAQAQRLRGCREDATSSVMHVYRFGDDPVEHLVWIALGVAGLTSVFLGILGCLAA